MADMTFFSRVRRIHSQGTMAYCMSKSAMKAMGSWLITSDGVSYLGLLMALVLKALKWSCSKSF